MKFNPFAYLFGEVPDGSLPEIFPVPIKQHDFVAIDVQTIFARILTDVFERTDGLSDEQSALLWDNCLGSETPDGLVTLLAKAMRDKSDLFIVYFKTLKVIRKADGTEQTAIRDGYKKKAEPVKLDDGGVGVFVSFKSLTKADMIKFYSGLEYCGVGGVWKQANVAKALQMKFKGMRGNVSVSDSAPVLEQAKKLATGLGAGQDIAIDGEDTVETGKPDLTASKAILELVAQKQSLYLGLPASYIYGALSGSALSDSGKADTKAIERGLRGYFFSIVKPISEGIFSAKVTFKSNDFEMIDSALEVLKTFDITSSDHLSDENKTEIVNKVFGLPKGEKGDEPKPPPPAPTLPPADPNAAPARPPAPPAG